MKKWYTTPMQMKVYNTFQIGNVFESIIEEKKSKFLGFATNVSSKSEVDDFLKKLSNEHSKARHICYAWRLIENGQVFQKSSDDGEPSGTAGKPILNIIEKNNLFNVCIVVVRYFGGIKLGAGNLLRAYSNTAKYTLENNIVSFELKPVCAVKIPYTHFNELIVILSQLGIKYNLKQETENAVLEVDGEKKEQICQLAEQHHLPTEIVMIEKMQLK